MYRIENEDGHVTAFAVCHQCKEEALANIWSQHGDSLQMIKPIGWTEQYEKEGSKWMMRLFCRKH